MSAVFRANTERFSIQGICQGVRQEVYFDGNTSNVQKTLLGEVFWDDSFKIVDSKAQESPLATSLVRIAGLPPAVVTGARLPDDHTKASVRTEAILSVCKEHCRPARSDLHVTLPAEQFDHLWEQASADIVLQIGADVPALPGSRAVDLDDYDQGVLVGWNVWIRVGIGNLPGGEWREHRIVPAIRRQLQREYIQEGSGWGELEYVATEFARCIAKVDGDERRHQLVTLACKIMSSARDAFRAPASYQRDGTIFSMWSLTVPDFEKEIGKLPEDEAKELKRKYNRLWSHFPVLGVIKQGEATKGPEFEGFKCYADQLNPVAAQLLAVPELASPTLEWALIDALIYTESIELARVILPTTRQKPFFAEEKFSPASPLKSAARAIAKSVGRLLLEGLKIGATVAIASAISENNPTATWTIATGVTGARWIRNAILSREANPKIKQLELLNGMVACHDMLASRNFNSRLLRDQLYRVTERGAAFSPYLFALLDLRIRRDAEPNP